jgi:hypothetical protein
MKAAEDAPSSTSSDGLGSGLASERSEAWNIHTGDDKSGSEDIHWNHDDLADHIGNLCRMC